MPPKTRGLIAHASYATLFANSQGVLIGEGAVWFSGVCPDKACRSRSVKIIAFNP